MPEYTVRRLVELLNDRGLPLKGTRVLGVGVAYKKNIADDRESPSIDVMKLLAVRGADLGVLDPHVPNERLSRHGFAAVEEDDDLTDWQVAIILTDHDRIDYEDLARQVDVVFDTRGIYRRRGIVADNVLSL